MSSTTNQFSALSVTIYREKYEIPLGCVRFEPTPATTAAPSPSESGDITTPPLRLLKTSFMEQYYAWLLWMTRRIGNSFGVLAHSLDTRNSVDPQESEAWKHYNLRFKQTSTKNSGPGSLLMQVLQKKVYREKYEIPLGCVRFEPTPATTAASSPSESGDITTAPLRLLKTSFMEQYYGWFLRMTRRIGYIC